MGWRMDETAMQMILTCKMTALAYSYQDMETMKNDVERVHKAQWALVVHELPSLLEFYSFLCFYPGLLVGPSFEYMDYSHFVHQKNEFENIPDPSAEALKSFGRALGFSALVVLLGNTYSHKVLFTDAYFNMSLFDKFVFFNVTGLVMKFRYTAAWKFTESAMTASGFGYTPEKPYKWSRAVSINYELAEFGWKTTKEMVENWNISAASWLRGCIYNRIVLSGATVTASSARKSIAQHCTYMVSALWHGFYPSYYLMFFLFSLLAEISKMSYESDFGFLPARGFFRVLAWTPMWMTANSLGLIFMLLDIHLAFAFLQAIYYFPVIFIAAGWLFFKATGLHRKGRKKKRQ